MKNNELECRPTQPMAGLPSVEAVTEAIVNADQDDGRGYRYADWIADEKKGSADAKEWLDARRAEAKAVLDLIGSRSPAQPLAGLVEKLEAQIVDYPTPENIAQQRAYIQQLRTHQPVISEERITEQSTKG